MAQDGMLIAGSIAETSNLQHFHQQYMGVVAQVNFYSRPYPSGATFCVFVAVLPLDIISFFNCNDVTFVSASKMNECKIWCRKPLKKVTTMVASEEVAKFIAIVALSETVALEIALWERTR